MKKLLIIPLLAALTAACGSKTQTYTAADGSVSATLNERTGEWHITGPDGREVVPDYDSMRVVEVSPDGHPMTIVYHSGNVEHWRQYYSTMKLRSEGDIVGGKREGHWVFYHPDGKIQAEATYIGGREEGPYRVFRENGAPYYLGQYHDGERVGVWEIYDEQGQLVGRQDYSAEG